MKLINQSCESLIQESGLNGIYKQIELAGRTCYKSLDKITSESAKPFVDRMIKSDHTAMLEHGAVYLSIPFSADDYGESVYTWSKYSDNKYSKVNQIYNDPKTRTGFAAITTNLRVIVENNWEDDLKYLCDPTEHHVKRYTLLCVTALHCYKDLTRHRTMSFAIESTRYCNYSKTEKFGEMTFIKPTWFDDSSKAQRFIFKGFLKLVEKVYKYFITDGWKAQQAAEVLPQCIKGDMVISGFEDDWKHLLDLRYYGTTGAPHPMVRELAVLMKHKLDELGLKY